MHYDSGEWWLMSFCSGAFYTRLSVSVSGFTIAYVIYLTQSILILELKKLQHDIRTCSIEEIPLIFPRIKTLLEEIHQICNKSHVFLVVYAPFTIFNGLMLLLSIYNLNVLKNENYQVPAWIIIVIVVPSLAILSFYAGFSELNRMTERDIDADLNDLLFRLQFAVGLEERVLRSLTVKLETIIRSDMRVCILPFHIIPDPTTAKQLISYLISTFIVIAPYVIAMKSQLIFDYLSMDKGDASEL